MAQADVQGLQLIANTKTRVYFNSDNYYVFHVAYKGSEQYIQAGPIRKAGKPITDKTDFSALWHKYQKRDFWRTKGLTKIALRFKLS